MTEETDRPLFERLATRAAEHYGAGRLSEAQADYEAALAASPENPTLLHNLGALSAARGELQSALGYFDRAIAAKPSHIAAHFSRAKALQELGDTMAAAEGFALVCRLDPEHYGAHRALAFLWLARGDRGRAMDHFARTYELRRQGGTAGTSPSLTLASKEKLLHDVEQFRFLAEQRPSESHFLARAQSYEAVGKDLPSGAAPLSAEQLRLLGEDYNTAINIAAAAELDGPAVKARPDSPHLSRQLAERGLVYFDDFLTDDALKRLRRYLLESTIWHDFSHIEGFVASYLEDGLASPLLLQIADDVRAAFPGLLDELFLTQAWAFKGLRPNSEVEAHADDAAYSLNFWLTPDSANLDPDGSGIVICEKAPPPDWRVSGYDADKAQVVSFLRQNRNRETRIPYRENRAVIFSSRLFHYSDRPRFSPGYRNHRINLTFLFDRLAKR